MAFSNPYQGITLPSIQKPNSEDYLAPQRATNELITSVDAHLKKVDTERADKAAAALMEAQNTGDTNYISSIMDYAANNITDLDKRNALINSGRGALENTAVTKFNYALAQAKDSGDLTALTELDKDVRTNPLYSPARRNELFTLLQANRPVIEETGLVRNAWNDIVAGEQAAKTTFATAADTARQNLLKSIPPKEAELFDKLLVKDSQGGYSRVDITPENAINLLGLPEQSRTPDAIAGAVNTAKEQQVRLFNKYGAAFNSVYKPTANPLEKAKQALTEAMMGKGKDPGAAIARIVSASATLQDPNKQASYEVAIAKNKEAAEASKKVIEDKAAFATAFVKAEQAKLIAGDKAPLNLNTALNGITTDWVNLGGYNKREATEITTDMKKNFGSYGLLKAPTDEELAYAITMSMATGFGDDPIVKKDTLVDVLKIHLDSKPVDTNAAKRQIIAAYNKNVSDKETLLNNVKAREARANLEAAYIIKGDKTAYTKVFDAYIPPVSKQNLQNNAVDATSNRGKNLSTPSIRSDEYKKYSPVAIKVAKDKGIPPGLLINLISSESSWNPTAISQDGKDKGIMQIRDSHNMSDAARYDPATAIPKGADILKQAYNQIAKNKSTKTVEEQKAIWEEALYKYKGASSTSARARLKPVVDGILDNAFDDEEEKVATNAQSEKMTVEKAKQVITPRSSQNNLGFGPGRVAKPLQVNK